MSKSYTARRTLLDLSLPDQFGYELLETVTKDQRLAFPPVIVYTGRSLDRDEGARLRRFSRSIIIKGRARWNGCSTR
jgi:CheY-like chemotaxis protein